MSPCALTRVKSSYPGDCEVVIVTCSTPRLLSGLANSEREAILGQRWRALSAAEKAPYRFTQVDHAAPAPAPAVEAHAEHTAAAPTQSPPPAPLPPPQPRRLPAPPPPPLESSYSPPAPTARSVPPALPPAPPSPVRPIARASPPALTDSAEALRLQELLTHTLEEMTGDEATDMLVSLGE